MPTAPRATRFECLDTLRGVAVLGILMVNVQFFSMSYVAADFPYIQGGFDQPANQAVWWITQTFFASKFITLFSAMFGAGIILMLGTGDAAHRRHWRRMIWLLMFGMIHAYIFWYGDILVPYALAGIVVVTARRMTPMGQVGLGLGLIAFTGLLMVSGAAIVGLVGEDTTGAEAMGHTPESIANVTALYQAGFFDRLPYNMGTALIAQLMQLVVFGGRIAGVMLLGMALFRLGFLTLGWSRERYLRAVAIAIPTGLLMCGWSATQGLVSNFDPASAWLTTLAQYVGSLVLAFGYAALVMLICQSGWLRGVTNLLAQCGRMAFTNYLTQTLLMTFIFVGMPGLGLFGEVDRVGQLIIVLAVWGIQLVWSPLWLARYRYGPLEWAWRSLTYGRQLPLSRSS